MSFKSGNQIPAGPGRDHCGGIVGVGAARQQVVRVVQRNKALGMLRSRKNTRGVLDAHCRIQWRMQHQQWDAQPGDSRLEVVTRQVVDETLAYDERPASQQYFRFAVRLDGFKAL